MWEILQSSLSLFIWCKNLRKPQRIRWFPSEESPTGDISLSQRRTKNPEHEYLFHLLSSNSSKVAPTLVRRRSPALCCRGAMRWGSWRSVAGEEAEAQVKCTGWGAMTGRAARGGETWGRGRCAGPRAWQGRRRRGRSDRPRPGHLQSTGPFRGTPRPSGQTHC